MTSLRIFLNPEGPKWAICTSLLINKQGSITPNTTIDLKCGPELDQYKQKYHAQFHKLSYGFEILYTFVFYQTVALVKNLL